MSEADEDAVTFLMPLYSATAWYMSTGYAAALAAVAGTEVRP